MLEASSNAWPVAGFPATIKMNGDFMKKILIAMMFAGAAMTGVSHAADKSPKQLAQQQKMKDCNAAAKTKELKGTERKAFMKTCLSGEAVAPAAVESKEDAAGPADAIDAVDKKTAQKEKMKACNAEAKSKQLKGQERKDFMKACLSG